jgi:hypothetical protein
MNALAKTSAAPAKLTNLFCSIDIKELNSTIAAIANRDDNALKPKEKALAISAINKWETMITEEIDKEIDNIDIFVEDIKDFYSCYDILLTAPEYFAPMAYIIDKSGLTADFKELKKLMDKNAAAQRECIDLEEEHDTAEPVYGKSKVEHIDDICTYRLNYTKKLKVAQTALRTMERKAAEIAVSLDSNADLQKDFKELSEHARKLSQNKKACANGANTVRAAITIDDKDLRKKITELLKTSFL